MRSDIRKAITGASIGNAVEWFDFAIYGFLAVFIAAQFFPAGNETAALLNTFAIFAAAFFMRPLGGFVFGSLVAATAAHCVLAAIESVYVSTAVSAAVEQFATPVRFSGFSIGYNICVAVFGGTTPYIVTWLTASTGNSIAPAYYLVIAAVVSLGTVLTLRETAGRSPAQVAPQPG